MILYKLRKKKKDNYYLSLFSYYGIGLYRELIIDKIFLFYIGFFLFNWYKNFF